MKGRVFQAEGVSCAKSLATFIFPSLAMLPFSLPPYQADLGVSEHRGGVSWPALLTVAVSMAHLLTYQFPEGGDTDSTLL